MRELIGEHPGRARRAGSRPDVTLCGRNEFQISPQTQSKAVSGNQLPISTRTLTCHRLQVLPARRRHLWVGCTPRILAGRRVPISSVRSVSVSVWSFPVVSNPFG